MDKNDSKVSSTEWGLVIGALLVIDLAQIGLDFIGIGLVINWAIDIFVGMSFALYLQLRLGALKDPSQIIALIISFILGEVTGGAAPMWFLDGVYAMLRYKKGEILSKIPGGNMINSATKK